MIATDSIRPLRATDAAWLHALHAECFGVEKAWNADLFAKTLIQPNVSGLVFAHDHQPAGFILLSVAADEAEILTFGVVPNLQRRKIATQLVRYACEDLQKMKVAEIFLEVAVNNVAAIALYRALGFKEKGLRKNYYQQGDTFTDAVIMGTALPLT